MATQENSFMETDHPLVRRIWKMLEEGIPSEFVEATNIVTSPGFRKSPAVNCCYDDDELTSGDHMTYFSKNVALAPPYSEELASAYNNRSSAFEYRMLYDLCLVDANRALAGRLPPGNRQPCLERRDVAWEKLQQQNALRSKMREGVLQIKRDNGQGAKLNARERELGYVSQVRVNDKDLWIDHSQLDDPIWNTAYNNVVPKKFSPKIVLRLDARLGPHWIAKEDIEPGEVLCTDEFYACTLHEHLKYKYCDYCHFRCDALIPCPGCIWDMYCSTACLWKAYHAYHRTECKIFSFWRHVDKDTREIRTLLLRTFLCITKQGSELASLMNSPVLREAMDGKLNSANVPFSPENYPIFANVVSKLRYSNNENMTCEPMMITETLAIFAALRWIQFFGNEARGIQSSGNILNAKERFGILLLVHQISLVIPQFFRLGVYVVDSLAEPSVGRYESIGFGFNLWQCFTLHSCDPNACKTMNKRHMLVYSASYIKAGEQICPFGHAEFMLHAREAQQDIFKKFGRPKCTCKACVEGWPTPTELSRLKDRYRTNDEIMIRLLDRARERLIDVYTRSTITGEPEKIIRLQKVLCKCVEQPSATIFMCKCYIERAMFSKGDMRTESE